MPTVALIVLRLIFVLVVIGLGVGLIESPDFHLEHWWIVIVGCLVAAAFVIGLDILAGRKRLETITAVYFGLLVGVLLTFVVRLALTPLLPDPAVNRNAQQIVYWVQLAVGTMICYGCISLLIQTKDDFRFIIPYVEFSKEIKGRRPYVLDTSVVIDGRIADVVETDVLDTQLIMPRFVIAELQAIADSADKMRRTPRPPRPGCHEQAPGQSQGRFADFRSRFARICRPAGRHEIGPFGQAPQWKSNYQRLQSEQSSQTARGWRYQLERHLQRAQARVLARRVD